MKTFENLLKRWKESESPAQTEDIGADVLTALESMEAERDALQQQVNALAAENSAKGRCLAFFASVIKCGEPWTETCQREYDAAQLRQPEEKGHE